MAADFRAAEPKLLCHYPAYRSSLQKSDGICDVCLCQVQPVAQGYGREAPLIEEEAPDIVDATAYSIQEDKLKTEDDNRSALQTYNKQLVCAIHQSIPMNGES